MDKMYKLTDLGKLAYKNGGMSQEETKVIDYLKNYKTATSSQLDCVGEGWVVRNLVSHGYVRDLSE
jgi:hypothetical protein